MSKLDGPKVSHLQREIIRMEAIRHWQDGMSAHTAKKVMKYLKREPRLLDIQLLPPYSPELNPVELVWGSLKSGRVGRMILRTKEAFLNAVSSGLKSIQRTRKMILGFFRKEHTAYTCLEKISA